MWNITMSDNTRSNNDDSKTSISISKETRKKLALLGKKFQSYDSIVQELILVWEKTS